MAIGKTLRIAQPVSPILLPMKRMRWWQGCLRPKDKIFPKSFLRLICCSFDEKGNIGSNKNSFCEFCMPGFIL